MPPEAQSRLCHSCASCFTLTRSCYTISARFSPVTQVESSTEPIILNDTTTSPFGLAVVSPCAFWLWQSNCMLEIKHHIIGELPEPCPVPWIGNFFQCWFKCWMSWMITSIYIWSLLESLHVHTLPFYVFHIFCLISVLLTWEFDHSMMLHHYRILYRLIVWESKYFFLVLQSMWLMYNLCLGILHIVLDWFFPSFCACCIASLHTAPMRKL